MNIVKKVKVIVNNKNEERRKEQYKFIRHSQYAQYQGLNRCMSYLMTGYYCNNMDIKSDGFKLYKKNITNSLFIFNDIEFGKGVDSKSSITQKVKKDFATALKNGLAKGERAVTNYKREFPLMTRGRDLKFKYDTNELDILVNWVNGIQFKCILGEHKNSLELKHTLHKVISGEYKLTQSSIYFNKKNELILVLGLLIDKSTEKRYFVEDRACGVCLGRGVPVYMTLSDDTCVRKSLGSYSEFEKIKLQYKSRRERLYRQLESVKGGKGRKDKLKAMDTFKEKERNFSKTYNHFLSSNIIKFAKKNKCQYINLEKINSDDLGNRVLGTWTYYDLQTKIKYKADIEGIKIRFVKSDLISQTCSKCGCVDKKNTLEQSKFRCNKCGFTLNIDYNASINISKSNKLIKE